jgi:hypothetical protein
MFPGLQRRAAIRELLKTASPTFVPEAAADVFFGKTVQKSSKRLDFRQDGEALEIG